MKPHRLDGKRNEWITPRRFIEAFVRLAGDNWIDPFAPNDNPLKAPFFITEEQNSLEQPWPEVAAVWANPPFSAGQLRPCLQRLSKEFSEGRRGILLLPVNNRLETGYYHEFCMIDALTAIVLVRGRVAFEEKIETEEGVTYVPRKSNLYATHLLCYNLDPARCVWALSDLGTVLPICSEAR